MKTIFKLLKKFKLAFLLVTALAFNMNAQHYKTIPDTSFVRFLNENFNDCMSGNQMDTTCPGIRNALQLNFSFTNISDFTGLEYFTALTNLVIVNNNLEIKFFPSLSFPDLEYFRYSYNNRINGNQPLSLPRLDFPKLKTFDCEGNFFTTLPDLNFPLLEKFYCSNNKLRRLDNLIAPNLKDLSCSANELTSLSLNYPKLEQLACSSNQLISLPPLPSTLCSLDCFSNKLVSLPVLPASLKCGLSCGNNNISCFPVFPDDLQMIFIAGNPFSCLPNYIPAMDAKLKAYPLCLDNNDTVNNPYNCIQAQGITGFIFNDLNGNCKQDVGESFLSHITVKLYTTSNVLINQTVSLLNGFYQFAVPKGNYKVQPDLAGQFKFSCQTDSVVASDTGRITSNVNFGIQCGAGNDFGVQSVAVQGIVFPGNPHDLRIVAGDLSKWYDMDCETGSNGKVEITVTGPVTYLSPGQDALTPAVSGNTYTYMISDFGSIDLSKAFGLTFITNTNAQAGNKICVTVHVSSTSSDIDLSNNDKEFCYLVVNSYDPNIKETYPIDVAEGYNDWFTYTIHFQNTGNAPAQNIVLTDTLDSGLNLETFQVLNYSHYNKVSVKDKAIKMEFPDIQLADSTTDPKGSVGFIQYRIKPVLNLPVGATIYNKAFIYFDYNAPIITNTTINRYLKTLSVDKNELDKLIVYPNPSNGIVQVKIGDEVSLKELNIEVYSILGKIIWSTREVSLKTMFIDLQNQPDGIYFLKVTGNNNSYTQRIIKQ